MYSVISIEYTQSLEMEYICGPWVLIFNNLNSSITSTV